MAPNHLFDQAKTLKAILERDDVDIMEELFANQLSMEMRLLHHIIRRILFSKIDRFDFISETDAIIIQHIIQSIHLNLPISVG